MTIAVSPEPVFGLRDLAALVSATHNKREALLHAQSHLDWQRAERAFSLLRRDLMLALPAIAAGLEYAATMAEAHA